MRVVVCIIWILCTINQAHSECISNVADVQAVWRSGSNAVLPCESAIKCDGNYTDLKWVRIDNQNSQEELVSWTSDGTESNQDIDISGVVYTLLANKSLSISETNIDLSAEYQCIAHQRPLSQNATDSDTTKTLVFTDKVDLTIIGIPSAPPGPPLISDINNTTMKVKWNASKEENNNPVTNYRVDYNSSDSMDKTDASGTEIVLQNLKPYTLYTLQIWANNAAGYSMTSSGYSQPTRTLAGVPTVKPVIQMTDVTNSSITLTFRPPASGVNGVFNGYVIQHKKINEKEWKAKVVKFDTYTLENLEPDTQYTVRLQITNNQDLNGPPLEFNFTTRAGVPSKPNIIGVTAQKASSFEVRWTPPTENPGRINRYELKVDSDVKNQHFSKEIYGSDLNSSPLKYNISGLSPDTKYSIELSACIGILCGPAAVYEGHTDVQVPGLLAHVNVSSNSSRSLLIRWNRPKNHPGKVDFYMIAYTVLNTKAKRLEPMDSPEKKMQDAFEVYLDNLMENAVYEVEMAAGSTSQFHYKEGNKEMPLIYWGPYSPLQKIQLMDGRPVEPMKSSLVGVIVGVVVTLLLLIILIIAFLVIRRRLVKKQEYKQVEQNVDLVPVASTYGTRRRSLKSDTQPRRDCIPICEFERHVSKNHADGDLQFSQEFDDINQNTRTDLTSKHSLEVESRLKNRYINILAYDHTRVTLRAVSGSPQSDYINANYIEGFEKPKAYIATQGPLANTFNDFWRMVWEQNTSVIVMITNLTEKGRRKCDQYWPSEGDHVYNHIHVTLLEESITAHYIVRKFKLKYAKDRLSLKKKQHADREITQFHFTEWPDHGVPNYSLPVLQFVMKSIAAIPESSGPPVVHCSAGVGRTGTYIVIDSMMKQIQAKNTVNVFSFLSHIRNQRNYMVQTEDQYVFIHDVLLEYIHGGETEVKDFGIVQYVKDLIKRDPTEGSLLEKQYKLVTSFEPKDFHIHSSQSEVNKEKNRSLCIVPDEMSRVRLPMKPGVPGSDYINASYLQGYNKTEEFIVTQHPLASTVEDFWRMVWDHNSMTVVLLSEHLLLSHQQEYASFWPDKEEDKEYGHFQIAFTGESQQGNLLCRDFLLQSTQDDYECTTRLISSLKPWPSSCQPLTSVFDLVDSVKHWHNQHEGEGPIVVVDSHGGQEAATFCALSTLKEQLEQEHSVDVYSTAKLYHLKRPGLFSGATANSQPGQDAYMFLYKAMESYTEMSCPGTDRDSGIGNGVHHYQNNTLNRDTILPLDPIPSARSPDKMPPPAVVRSMSRSSTLVRGSQSEAIRDSLKESEA